MSEKIRVLIVDDSSLMREAVKNILSSDPDIEVVGMAKDGREGVEKALSLRPQVVTMDLKMPVMNGIEAIEEIMQNNPLSIIVVSSLDVNVIVKALGIGAMDFVSVTQDIERIAKDLLEKVKIASHVRPMRRIKFAPIPANKTKTKKRSVSKVVAIGISTGGPQALQMLFSKLPHDLQAGIVVVQHMSEGFIEGMAEWLRQTSPIDIRVANSGDVLKSGTVFLAPDKYHMEVTEDGMIILREETKKTLGHVPSIDVLMSSVAKSFGENAMGIIMTGMGKDGASGIAAMHAIGALTIAQDEATSVIYGMNKAAIEAHSVDRVLSLNDIPAAIIEFANEEKGEL